MKAGSLAALICILISAPLCAGCAGPGPRSSGGPPGGLSTENTTPVPIMQPPDATTSTTETVTTVLETSDDIELDQMLPSLAEQLGQARLQLKELRDENRGLQATVADLSARIKVKDEAVARLEMRLQDSEKTTEALEGRLAKWQEDVLGFRAEMRDAAEAQINVLEKVLLVLEHLSTEQAKPKEPEE